MGVFLDLFTDYTLRNVALGTAILGVVSGVIGCFAVLRRQGLFGDALAHATLPGVCLAFIATGAREPAVLLGGAAITAVLGAILILAVTGGTRIKQDAALGIVLSVFFGIGTVLLTYIAGSGNASQSGIDRFIFGQAATIVRDDVVAMAALGAVALIVVALCFKEFKLVAFDPAFAASLGFPVGRINVLLTALIVVAIVIGIQTVGVILMAALLITPAASARQWTDGLSVMVVLSAFFGAASGLVGAMISATGSGLPTGPIIVLVATGILLFSLTFGARHGLVWERVREIRNRRSALRGDAS